MSKTIVEKAGCCKPQLRILAALAAAKGPLNRHRIAEKAPVDKNWVVEYLGSENPVSEFVRGHKKLVCAGLVKAKDIDIDGKTERTYEITATGRKLLERAVKDNAKPSPKAEKKAPAKAAVKAAAKRPVKAPPKKVVADEPAASAAE